MKNTIDIRTGRKAWTDAYRKAPAGAGRNNTRTQGGIKSEKGIALVVVLVLSGVALALMTALIYMITSGTQIAGFQKRYKTSLEAGRGGTDLVYSLIGLRGDNVDTNTFNANLNTAGLNPTISLLTSTCTGTSSGGTGYEKLQAKLLTPTASWTPGCDSSLSIDPNNQATYDMKLELGGTTNKYNYYAKIISTVEGNTGPDGAAGGGGFGATLHNKGVVTGGGGEIPVSPKPYLYAMEVLATSVSNTHERSKLSILYAY
jgi:hypothetical protein